MGFLDKLFGGQPAPAPSQIRPGPAPTAPASTSGAVALRMYEDGMRLMQAGQKREGLLRFTEAVQADPRCVQAHVALASAFYMINPVKYAENILSSTNAALAVEPAHAKAKNIAAVTHFALGKSAWDSEQWDAATSSFRASYGQDAQAEHVAEGLAHCAEQASWRSRSKRLRSASRQMPPTSEPGYWLADRTSSWRWAAGRSREDSLGKLPSPAAKRI